MSYDNLKTELKLRIHEADFLIHLEAIVKKCFTTNHNSSDPVRNADIYKRRYGLNGYHEHTLKEIGAIYGITRERVRQLISVIHSNLKKQKYFKGEEPK